MLKRAILSLCAAFTIFAGYAQQKATVDKVIAVVGNSGIMYSDVYETSERIIRESRRRGFTSERNPMSQALESLLAEKLLFQQAVIDSIPISSDHITKMVEEELREMIAEAGSISELEKRESRPIFEVRQNLTSQYEEQAYAEGMRSSITRKIRITPGEVDRYYRGLPEDKLPIVPEQYVYAQIAKYPIGMQEAKFKARETLLGYRERIQHGEMTFEDIAVMYSDDKESSSRGGELPEMPLEYFDVKIAAAVENLKAGQVSDVVESASGFELFKMVSKKGNNYIVKRILRRPVYAANELAATDAMLDSLRQLIVADSISFADAAKAHSDDKFSKMNGGIVSNLEQIENSPYTIPASYATTRHKAEEIPIVQDVVELRSLKPGEISAPFASTDLNRNAMRKILKLVEIIPAHKANLKEDYIVIEQSALQEKQFTELEKWMSSKIDRMYVRIDPEYQFDDFDVKAWFK